MTRTRYKIHDTHYPYFLTCTVNGWLPVFTQPAAWQIIIDTWRYQQTKHDLHIFGFVILTNHLHVVAASSELPELLHRFKSYTARKIIETLKEHGATTLLRQLKAMKLNHKKDSEYQVWQEGSKPKQILSEEMMRQKIEYTHYNPVKRGYVERPEHWLLSSARNYAGESGLIEVVRDWR